LLLGVARTPLKFKTNIRNKKTAKKI
jgi:hypothetical protein